MKLKLNFGKGGLKGFVIQHAEKGIFGMVLVLVAAFIYSSATQETVEQGESPSSLKGGAAGALTTLQNGNPWAALAPDRQGKVDNYPARVGIARQTVDDAAYRGTTPWIKDLVPRQQKRQDPELYAPSKVEAQAGVFAVMMRTTRPDDAWSGDKDAVEQPKEKPKPKPKKEKRPRGGMYGGSYGDMMGGSSSSSDMSMMYGSSGGDMAIPTMEYGSEMGGMGSGYGMAMPGMAGGKRALGQFYISHYLSKGYRPTVGMGMPGVAARSYAMVAVKALVPYEKQWEEYERALANATGYSPMHDIPKYLLYVAERAEVSDDPNAPLQWQTISNSSVAIEWATKNFAGFPPEVADEAYLLRGLTMPIPPILMQPYDSLALHSEVPKKKLATNLAMVQPGAEEQAKTEGTEEAAAEPKPSADFSEGLPKMPPTGAGMGGYGMMPGMAPGMGYPGSSDMGSGAGMYGGEMYGGGMYGSGTTSGMEGYGSMGGYPGAMGGYGMESGGYGMPGMGMKQPIVKHKMIRFFDFTAEPGKSYQYRVRVMIEDPNRPLDKTAEPNPRILDQAVVDRLAKLTAADEEYQKASGKPRRTYWLQTEWSEPSNIVTVVVPEKFVGGGAIGGRSIKLAAAGPAVEIEEPKGKVVTAVWDRRRATEVPAEREVLRGAFLDFTDKADVLQPLTLQIKRIEEFNFDTEAFVADLRGGESLLLDVDKTTKEENPLPVPGEYLVVDGDGRLIACSEVDDAEEYRRLLFIEDTPGAATGGMMPSSGTGGYGETMGYPSSYPSYGTGS
jgi:hypothetical protein